MKNEIREARTEIEIVQTTSSLEIGIKDINLSIHHDGSIGIEVLEHIENGETYCDDVLYPDDFELVVKRWQKIKYNDHVNNRRDRHHTWTDIEDFYKFVETFFPNYETLVKDCRNGIASPVILMRHNIASEIFKLIDNPIPSHVLQEFKFQLNFLDNHGYFEFYSKEV